MSLTEEMKSLLWEDYLLDNPKIAQEIEKAKEMQDDEFERMWNETSMDDKDIDITNSDDINISEVEENVKEFMEADGEVNYPSHAKSILEKIKKHKKEQDRINNLQAIDWDDGDDDFLEV